MLVLSRKPSQQIIVGDDPETQITITVVRVHGQVVRIGVEAPQHVKILRAELGSHFNESASNP